MARAAASRRRGVLAWVLAGVLVAVLAGLWLTFGREPALLERAQPVAIPPSKEPAPMPAPRPVN